MKNILLLAIFCSGAVFAAPQNKAEETAPGFPAWIGVTPANYVNGRDINGAFLRHRFVAVIDLDDDKLEEQLTKLPRSLANSCDFALSHSDIDIDKKCTTRNLITVYSVHGKIKPEQINKKLYDLLVSKKLAKNGLHQRLHVTMYKNMGIEKAPDSANNRPYVYIMGPVGDEPIYHAPIKSFNESEMKKAIKNASGNLGEWRAMFGTVSDPKLIQEIENAVAKGKPLKPIVQALRKKSKSSNPEIARQSQILADAIEQEKYDTARRIYFCSSRMPWVAMSMIKKALKLWPELKKFSDVIMAEKNLKRISSDIQTVCKAYDLNLKYADPNFIPKNAGVAKKAVIELRKIVKMLEPLKDSKDIEVQNGVLLLIAKLETLIETIPSKVP